MRLALGLIREAATTELGKEIINDLRSNATRKRQATPTDAEQIGAWRRSVDERISVVDRNIEMLVEMSNAQDEMLLKIQRRQRVWNLVLALLSLALLGGFVVLVLR
jgi:hypothetical protein